MAEIPAFPVNINRGIDTRELRLQSDDKRFGMEAHDIETEAVHSVLARPGQHRVGEELAHHVVFRGRVLATAAGLY